jgi:hypothetical protein
MTDPLTVEDGLIQIERWCGVAAGALAAPDLSQAACDGLIVMLEEASGFASLIRSSLEASVLVQSLEKAA